MYNRFVQTSNVSRFLGAVAAVEDRGASETCFLLVGGNAGFGKTRCGQWWALQNDAVFLRIKAAATPHWVLTDLVRELGEQAPAHSCEKLFAQAIGQLVRERRPIVIDEVENAVNRDITVLETIRDVADLVEVPVVLLGREYVRGKLKRHPQIWTRISAAADFGPATLADVRKCCDELCEIAVAEDVIGEIHRRSEGHIREIVKAIKNVERIGKRNGGATVTMDKVGDHALTQDWSRARKAA